MGSRQFADKPGGPATGQGGDFRIGAPLETEGGVGLQLVFLGRLADRTGIEAGALQEDLGGRLGYTRILPAEHTRDAHRPRRIGNDDIGRRQGALDTVQRDNFLTLLRPADDDLSAADLGRIEGVQGLSELEQDEVGNIHHVVDGTQTDGQQLLLQPLRRFFHLHAREGDARISRSSGSILHFDRNFLPGALGEAGIVRTLQRARDAIVHQVGIQIAGDTPVGGRIHAVRGNFIFDDRLGLEVEVLLGGRSHHGIFRKDHDSLVGGTDAQFILGTNHSEGFHAADFGFLDLEIARKHGSDAGEQHFLACRHVRGAANDR